MLTSFLYDVIDRFFAVRNASIDSKLNGAFDTEEGRGEGGGGRGRIARSGYLETD